MFLIVTVTISQSLRSKQIANLHWEMIQANYAAECGIAQAQAKLHANISSFCVQVTKVNHITVRTEIQKIPLQIRAVAYGRFGVKQTIVAHLSPMTYKVVRWAK